MDSTPEIYRSTDYERFHLINGNRNIVPKKVEKIVGDVEKGLDLFPFCPIIVCEVDGKLNIIDGQHRFKASRELKKPIYYVVAENISIRDIARMNNNTDKWKFNDFMDCYIKLGMGDYVVLRDFIRKYRVNHAPALALLANGSAVTAKGVSEKFKDGEFKVNHLERATEVMDLTIKLFDRYKFCRDRNLIEAVSRLMGKDLWELDRMEEKLTKHPGMMDQCTSYKTYIMLIEQIYNMSAQHRKIIY
nr:ParB/RepB/Spo0J family partition protein [Allomuricauda sp.]